MNQLIPFADEEIQSSARKELDQLIKKQRKKVSDARHTNSPFSNWVQLAIEFLKYIGSKMLVALSPDYETRARLDDVIRETFARVKELLKSEPDLPKALGRFADDQAVRILTIHKSKGLEFDSVIILGIESQTFWGKPDAERCAFFVGISRAKKRLVLTVSDRRETPPSNPYRWQENRTQHEEFIGYVTPFLRIQ